MRMGVGAFLLVMVLASGCAGSDDLVGLEITGHEMENAVERGGFTYRCDDGCHVLDVRVTNNDDVVHQLTADRWHTVWPEGQVGSVLYVDGATKIAPGGSFVIELAFRTPQGAADQPGELWLYDGDPDDPEATEPAAVIGVVAVA